MNQDQPAKPAIVEAEVDRSAELPTSRRKPAPPDPRKIFLRAIHRKYRIDGLDRWSNARVLKCAANVRVSIKELCALSGVFNSATVEGYQRRNKWPMYLTIQFNKFERFAIGMRSPDAQDAATIKLVPLLKQEDNAS